MSPIKYSTIFTIRVDQEFLDAVEELRELQRSIPTKSNVVREAVMEALKRAKARVKR